MKKAMEVVSVATAKAVVRWFGGLPRWGKLLTILALIAMGIPASIGAFVVWVAYKLTLAKAIK